MSSEGISYSVGLGGRNLHDDVKRVQDLLIKNKIPLRGGADGHCGQYTIQAIKKFQSHYMRNPDGRVDVGGRTWKKLAGSVPMGTNVGAPADAAVLAPVSAQVSNGNDANTRVATVAAVGTGNSRIITYDDESQDIRTGGSRAWRNNNPGNIEAGTFANGEGAIGTDGRFAIFPDEETGAAAVVTLLRRPQYQTLTVAGAIARYAPPNENNTTAYQQIVVDEVGVPGTTQMNTLTNNQLDAVVRAIRRVEGWQVGTVTHTEAGDSQQ
jgi:peptidoglycan hydrolase-like protein with peptidoglycan-binding domain